MPTVELLLTLVAAVLGMVALARRLGAPAPLVLVLGGFGLSYVPWMDGFTLRPDIVLIGLLPPLLYSAALRTSLVDFRRNIRPIALLSVGLVAFSVVTVGFVTMWVLPVPPAAAFALGAVVAPPDAVAASAIARRVGMPRKLVTILEGESLMNDATALVALRTATAALATVTVTHVSAAGVAGEFVAESVGGLVAGWLVATVTGHIRRHVEDVLIDTTLSLLTPFIAYLLAEGVHVGNLHGSGVLAVVTAGLLLGHKSYVIQSAKSRMMERTNWRTIAFVLENAVFAMIGLQARQIVHAVRAASLPAGTIVAACVLVLVTAVVARLVWIFPSTYLTRLIPRLAARDPAPNWRAPMVLGWAGMRGVVTLAAALSLPQSTPYREVLVLAALVVVGGTLLVQGSTLPAVIRLLGLTGPDQTEDTLVEANVYQRAVSAGLDRLDEQIDDEVPEQVRSQLRSRSLARADAVWERLGGRATVDDGTGDLQGDARQYSETPSVSYARLRLAMLVAEREAVLAVRDAGTVDAAVLTRVLAALDIEETMLVQAERDSADDEAAQLSVGARGEGGCEHLREAPECVAPLTPDGCQECLEEGRRWVHLRMCLSCGHVGCCDSSEGRHADRHFHHTGHPVMRSFEIGEAWRWCYVDELLG